MCRVRFACVLAIAVTTAAHGQTVNGVVRDSATRQPISGAVVSVVDATGKTLRRTIADQAGKFILPVDAAAARLRVLRIGFQPRDVPLAAGDISMIRLPALLPVVRVSDRPLCPGSSDRGLAFVLWEQARAALLAAVVAREA